MTDLSPGTSKHHLSQVWRLAWPTIMENLLTTSVSFADTAMVGSLGAAATAAVAINTSPTWMLNNLVMGISVGSTVLVARHMGAQERGAAQHVAKKSLMLCLMFAVVLSLFVVVFGGYIPVWMGGSAEIIPQAGAYMRIVGAAFVPHYLSLLVGGIMRGAGDTRTPMLVSLLSNMLNVIGNFLLIFPTRIIQWGGVSFTMPGAGMGVAGAALATAIATATAGVVALTILFMRGRSPAGAFGIPVRGGWKWESGVIKRVLKVGIPAALERILVNLGQIILLSMVARLGTVYLAAHHLAITAESLSYMPAYGFAAAATTLVGNAMGARQPETAHKYGNWTFAIGVTVACATGLLLFLFPSPLLSLFSRDAAVIAAGVMVLRVDAFAQPFFATSIILAGALRGGGDTRYPLYISFASMWGVRLVLAAVCVYGFHLGFLGIWIGMVADLCIRGILVFLRWRSGRWKSLVV